MYLANTVILRVEDLKIATHTVSRLQVANTEPVDIDLEHL